MSKRVDVQYTNKIISLAQKRYDSCLNKTLNQYEKDQMDYPHLFVLGCVMDSQIDYTRAWKIPFIVADELKSKDFNAFEKKSKTWYFKLFKSKNLHRFNDTMAAAFYSAIQRIKKVYNGDAAKIWNDNPTSGELICRFLEFDRVGIKIATMAANILSRDYGIKIKDKYAIDISPDVHVKRLMYRLGLISEIADVKFSSIDASKITYAARSINPTFPGLLDLIFWEVGSQKICENTKCHKNKCPFGAFCIKQGVEKNQIIH